ncbi:MAG TPA: porin [Phycisphaerales bacterium]|nr:porin [Phycisphaerales bacterium]
MTRRSSIVSAAVVAFSAGLALAGDDTARATRAELAADAVAKTQYMEKAKGFFITDGENKLKVGGFTQFRYLLNFRDDPDTGSAHDSGFANGFELARTRLNFSGNVLDPNLKFKVEGEFSRTTGEMSLLDSFITYAFSDELTLRVGQFKAPLQREQLVSDVYQLAIERSVVDSVFNQGRTQGVELQYTVDSFRGMASINDGLQALNTRYTSTTEADVGVTARAEFKFGEADWKQFEDFTSFRGGKTGGLLGAAVHWQHDGNTATPGSPEDPQSDLISYTVDFSFESDGWNMFIAGIGSHYDEGDSSDSLDDFGVVAQAGFFVSDHDEIFGRWDWVAPDSDRAEDDDFNTLTVGWNHYFIPESHAAKFSTDLCWFLNEPSNNELISTNGRNALLPDNNDNQIAVRFQFQLIF